MKPKQEWLTWRKETLDLHHALVKKLKRDQENYEAKKKHLADIEFLNQNERGKMMTYFNGHGHREVKNWSCDICKNYSVGGMDLLVDESSAKHRMKCLREQKVISMRLAGSEIVLLYHWIKMHTAEKHPEANPLIGFEQSTSGIGNTTVVLCILCGEKKNITDTRIW